MDWLLLCDAGGSGGHSGKESGHKSVSTDLEFGYEDKARQKLKVVLWKMFQDRAFSDSDGEYVSGRTLDKEEFDFVSHLRVSQDMAIIEKPHVDDFKLVSGNLDMWLAKLKNSEGDDVVGDVSKEQRLTPTKESCREHATHYIVCETKMSMGKKSVSCRLEQLERKVLFFTKRAFSTSSTEEEAAVQVDTAVALAGVGAPRRGAVGVKALEDELKFNREQYPLLRRLNELHRLFVVFVETAAERLLVAEEGVAKVQEEVKKMHEEQKKAQKEQRKAQRKAQKEQRRAQEEQRRAQEETLQSIQQQIAVLTSLVQGGSENLDRH